MPAVEESGDFPFLLPVSCRALLQAINDFDQVVHVFDLIREVLRVTTLSIGLIEQVIQHARKGHWRFPEFRIRRNEDALVD